MRDRVKSFIARNKLAVAVFICTMAMLSGTLAVYVNYLDDRIYDEGTTAVELTYRQTAKTFLLFAQRNWNYLSDVDNYVANLESDQNADALFTVYATRANNWEYSDVYLFNEECDYHTIAQRSGRAESIKGVFDKLFDTGEPLIASYISSAGARKVVFARKLTNPLVVDGVTYTALAVSYDNDTLQDFLSANAFEGNSDCYIVEAGGDVVFSLEEKSMVTEFVGNFDTFFSSDVAFKRGDAGDFASDIAAGNAGCGLVTYEGRDCYAVWLPCGLDDLSLVALVDSAQVDRTANDVRNSTIGAFSLVLVVVCASSLGLFYHKYLREMAEKTRRSEALERKNKMATQLFEAMASSYERYAVGDLVRDTYIYHEFALDEPSYLATGAYRDLIAGMNRNFTLCQAQDGETIASLLSPGRLQRVFEDGTGLITFEYESVLARRDGKLDHLMMNVAPVAWQEDGKVSKVLLFASNINAKVELEAQALTDELTGLYNKRGFTELTSRLQRKGEPFTLYFLDLDRFKPVNDTFGHDAGDKLLREVASRLRSCVRSDDYVFRLGGDEFVLVTCGAFNADVSRMLVSRVEGAVEQPFIIDGNEMSVGTSCGFAGWPEEGETLETIQALADARMYRQKQAHHGRG